MSAKQLSHEIIHAIADCLDIEEELTDLRNLASVNKRYYEIIRPILFHYINLDRYEFPDPKRKARIETLCRPGIAGHVRELDVGIWSMMPKFFLDYLYYHKENGKSHEEYINDLVPKVPECAFDSKDRKCRGRTRWSRTFEAGLSQLFAACCKNLCVLRITFRKRSGPIIPSKIHKEFCNAVARQFVTFQFPRLEVVRFETEHLQYIEYTFTAHLPPNAYDFRRENEFSHADELSIATGQELIERRREVKNIEVRLMSVAKRSERSRSEAEKLGGFLEAISPQILEVLHQGDVDITFLATNRRLCDLRLQRVRVNGVLSNVLASLRKLNTLVLDDIRIYDSRFSGDGGDTWADIFNTCYDLPNLQEVIFNSVGIVEDRSCSSFLIQRGRNDGYDPDNRRRPPGDEKYWESDWKAICTTFEEDEAAFERLYAKMRKLSDGKLRINFGASVGIRSGASAFNLHIMTSTLCKNSLVSR